MAPLAHRRATADTLACPALSHGDAFSDVYITQLATLTGGVNERLANAALTVGISV